MHRCGSHTFLRAIAVKIESVVLWSQNELRTDEVHLKLETPELGLCFWIAFGEPLWLKNVTLARVWCVEPMANKQANSPTFKCTEGCCLNCEFRVSRQKINLVFLGRLIAVAICYGHLSYTGSQTKGELKVLCWQADQEQNSLNIFFHQMHQISTWICFHKENIECWYVLLVSEFVRIFGFCPIMFSWQ